MIKRKAIIGVLAIGLALTLPFLIARYQQKQFRNFRVVKNGVLYRSGQMTLAGVKKVVKDLQIKTIISLRDSHDTSRPAPDAQEEEFSRSQGIRFLRLSPKRWEAEVGEPPVMENVRRFVDTLNDPKCHPVLVHCFAGIHRTGSYCAIYRMEFEGWSNSQAIEELKKLGYHDLEKEPDVFGFLKNYRPTHGSGKNP